MAEAEAITPTTPPSLFQEIANNNIERLDREGRKPGATAPPAKAVPASNVVRLPVAPESTRAVPNAVLRSALFGIAERGARRYLEDERIASVEGLELFFTGKQLDQGDLDVWLAILHLCRRQAMGERCEFTAYQLLKLLGRTISGKSRQVLNKQVVRLHAALVRIQAGKKSYSGHLIHHIGRDDETKRYCIVLNPEMQWLFGENEHTLIDWQVRRALAGKPLAQWLHGFYASHAQPHALRVETLRELSGSEQKERRDCKRRLRSALDAVREACSAHGQLFEYSIEEDLVRVSKAPSKAQRRHLQKRPIKRPKRTKT